jgi:hypothetical protein
MSKPKIIEMKLTSAVAEKRIHEISILSENVILGSHALKRMEERDITDADVFRVLRTGFVDDSPTKVNDTDWKCKITLKIRGGRTVGVVTIILHRGKLFVKTVEWEDMK